MKVFFSVGGTGGHIYPALSLAESFEKKREDIEISFVVSEKKLDKDILSKTKYTFYPLASRPFKKGVLKTPFSLFFLLLNVLKAFFICVKQRPHVVIGTGGYASVPFVIASAFLGIPCFLWEANSHPGLANRFLSRFVKKAFVVFESSKKFLKTKDIEVLGYPLRSQIENLKEKNQNERDKKREQLHSKEEKEEKSLGEKTHISEEETHTPEEEPHTPQEEKEFFVLVLGGSQGSQAINKVVSGLVSENLEGVHILHQTGKSEFETYKELYKNSSFMKAYDFFYHIEEVYRKAHLVISRSGAGALFELACLGKPSIFIPLPHSSDNHQLKNAKELVSQNACLMNRGKRLRHSKA